MSGVSWDASAEDFGQKVDLTVRIREILRNYPEGLSILKELIQNADDAGARTVRFCAAEARQMPNSGNDDALSDLMKGPSLLAFNSGKFTEVDFKSIQQIGDSLKKDAKGTKTGRFGVGVNSTYHLTDVPMFVSGTKVVMFDPQACFVPGINPANPGKMVDCSKANGRKLVQSLPHVFDPLRVFGCRLEGEDFNGTTFRFALRTAEQAQVSRLSRQSHPIEKMRDLLVQMASAAPTMLLFLKNVECIEIYDWKQGSDAPTLIHRTHVSNCTENIRNRRSYVLNASSRVPQKPVPVDYILDIQSNGIGDINNGGDAHATERWIVCNQLGGGRASQMANDPKLSHMKLIPWAGVAARLSPPLDVSAGKAYCFLPLPVNTSLPIHVNGYFELSSNRRDVWSGSDMAGDGKARAEWNESIVQAIAAPSYVRLIAGAIKTKSVNKDSYESLFPQTSLSGIWELLCVEFMKGVKDEPVLYSECTPQIKWVAPSKCLLPHDDNDTKLNEILSLDQLPLVRLQSKELKEALLKYRTCSTTATSAMMRKYFASRGNKQSGALESSERKFEFAAHLLSYCLKDINPTQYSQLAGCQFIPLANGELGRFCVLPPVSNESLVQLQSMGFPKLSCAHSLRVSKGNIDAAMEWLLKYRYEDEAVSVQHGVDPYLICSAESASLLMPNASKTFVNLDAVDDPKLKKFFDSGATSKYLNLLSLQPEMLADVVIRSVPRKWRGNESAKWNPDESWPNVEWFVSLWRFICSCNDISNSLRMIAEQYCIVPTQQGIVCALSPGASVIDPSGLEDGIVKVLVGLGVRMFYADVFPTDLVIPKSIWSYVFQPSLDGIIKVIDTALRRESTDNGANLLHQADDQMKEQLFQYFAANAVRDKISTPCKVMIRNFPIFRAYYDENDSKTKFVSMGTKYWNILENAMDEDRMLMTSNFLACSNRSEFDLLCELGAKSMKKTEFFKMVVTPQLSSIDEDLRNNVVGRVLVELPSLCAEHPEFHEIFSQTKCIPSAVTKTLKCATELYDPGVSSLVNLMDNDSFPDEFFMKADLLLSLRKLGLQSTLTWDVILDCARSIEADGVHNHEDENRATIAKARGGELLMFLDNNVDIYFPDLRKKKKSRTGGLFRKMNEALFQDTEQIKKDKQLHALRVSELLTICWMPVQTVPPNPFLPWPENCDPVAAPFETVTSDKMWLASYTKRLVDGDIHSVELKKTFGWLDEVSIKDIALQLRMLGKSFVKLKKEIEDRENQTSTTDKTTQLSVNALCQKISSEVGRIYHILNNVESEYELEVMKSVLHRTDWLWMGDAFVSSDHIAFTSSINATPYLFTVPPDLACFKNLLAQFSVRTTFGSSDFCLVLNRMAEEQKSEDLSTTWNDDKVELAVNLVQKISDDVLRLRDYEIYAPTSTGKMMLANSLVYDDAPWLSKDLVGKKELTYVHKKLSASVCEKIGVKSVRKILLQSNANMIKFGDSVVHEAFGQSESLTRRLKNIVEMYPEGPQQLSELIQNADDAHANVVKFIISKRQHGKSSLLGQKMSEWQGGGLYCYNDATFTSRDFENLSKIGQASKLQKLVTTGRFGLGFNSVFHWTDVPSLVSGDYLVMFDPHTKYVPGATDVARGIKIRFSDSELVNNFPDQVAPYFYCGCTMKNTFNGTLFRFPFRNNTTAAESEISKKQYCDDEAITELIANFKKVISKVVLFLRHVKRVEVHLEEDNDDGPKLLYYAEVTKRENVPEEPSDELTGSGFDGLRSLAVSTLGMLNQSNDWNAIARFISGPESQAMSKEAFYSKLLRTPENQLPQTRHLVTINFVNYEWSSEGDDKSLCKASTITDQFLICSALGAGKCRAMACKPEHMDLKFLPWAGIAAHLRRNDEEAPHIRGNAFCFLPLPAETGFSVHLNGYFELSANRRDIWYGDDMSGAGKTRSEWNQLLLSDVVSPLYIRMLKTARFILGPGKQYDRLWPVKVNSEIWKIVRSRVFSLASNQPLVYTSLNNGKWCNVASAVFMDSPEYDSQDTSNIIQKDDKKRMINILLQENISVVSMSPAVISCMTEEKCGIIKVSPSMAREWFRRPSNHPSLHDRDNVVFLLRFCIEDLIESSRFDKLSGLPMLPLLNGLNGTIRQLDANEQFYVPTEIEKTLLDQASFKLVDVFTKDERLNNVMKSEKFYSVTNVKALDIANFVGLLSHSYPEEWTDLPEVRWIQSNVSNDRSPANPEWISMLWDYIVSDKERGVNNLKFFESRLQILPTLVGKNDRTLQTLTKNMAVVNITEEDNSEIASILWAIGIRTLDDTAFNDKGRINHALKPYVHAPTVRGIIKALTNSIPDISDSERNKRMAAKFHYLNKTDKKKFRSFLRDSDDLSLSEEEKITVRSLPIFEVFTLNESEGFSQLSNDSCLPPSCAERKHLDSRFVKATSRKDIIFLEALGIETMEPVDYYGSYLCESLALNRIGSEGRSFAVMKLLQDVPAISEDKGGEELMTKLSHIAFVPNAQGEMMQPRDLYDPHEPGLVELVDQRMLPSVDLRHGGILQTLRTMGMKTKLSSEGIIDISRSIEYEAKNLSIDTDADEIKIAAIRKRAFSLLNFLDDDKTVETFLSEITELSSPASQDSDTGEVELSFVEGAGAIVDELNSICWLPVEQTGIASTTSEPRPPRRQHQLSRIGIASPKSTRPKTDEWICSKSSDVLSSTLKSEALIKLFEWNQPPPMSHVGSQLVALSSLCDEFKDSQTLRQHLATVTSQMYEILDSSISSASREDNERLYLLLEKHPWIWVGDKFVSTAQVAYNAPDNAKPFLYTIPDAMTCFERLLRLCRVRDSFSGEDFVKLLSSLAEQLNGQPCNDRQLDLAIFVARYLSRVPQDEFDILDKSKIFLPSEDQTMHKSSQMTFDDAPWLSAIVKRSRHIFVHQDVGNEVARTLGSNSLRDVLSANQNGMVKVPCPKVEALDQLLRMREYDSKEVGRIVLDLVELAEMKSTKQISITIDQSSYDTMSLLHPCLAPAQGPALIVCFHDVAMEVDELVKLTSPVNYYSSATGASSGSGGSGFPRYGRGLCGAFGLTDCLQILTGRSLLIFDPNGDYFIEDLVTNNTKKISTDNGQNVIKRKKKERATARNYGISSSFCSQFPDQFEPFLSLPYGVEESLVSQNSPNSSAFYRGTIIRLPFRSSEGPPSRICDKVYEKDDMDSLILELESILPQSLLFTYHLQSVNLDTKAQLQESKHENHLTCRVSSSPLSRRSHLEELWENKAWKQSKSKFGKMFKSNWNPVRTSHSMQISTRMSGKDTDIIDTYMIMSILAPPRLKDMANTESLTPLNLLPLVSVAAHLCRSPITEDVNTTEYIPAEGTLFVGLPTGIKTGLPFHINAPLFLHEWTGDVLLDRDDDDEFKVAFPGIRNVTTIDKQNMPRTRSLALYVWNRQALLSSTGQLFPPLLKEIRNSIHLYTQDHRLLYRFWPFYDRILPRLQEVVDSTIYNQLGSPSMDIYLTERNGFRSIGEGCFASPDYQLNDASDYFLQKMALFTTPKLVVEDLNRFGVDGRQLTPSVARSLLRGNRHVSELNGRPREILAILQYCLADLVDETDFGSVSKAAKICRQELLGLQIVPLSDGTIGRIGNKIIVADQEHQAMLPSSRRMFLWPRANEALEPLLSNKDFLELCRFETFGPEILAENVSTVVPQSWHGKDFVSWDGLTPSKSWLYQFWNTISIWDHDTVQLFKRWPLIPTKSGELASCSNVRFILFFSMSAFNESLASSLVDDFEKMQNRLEIQEKRDLVNLSAERRLRNSSMSSANIDSNFQEFWAMGEVLTEQEPLSIVPNASGDQIVATSEISAVDDESREARVAIHNTSDDDSITEFHETSSAPSHENIVDDAENSLEERQLTTGNTPNYDPSSATFRSLFEIMVKIQCPLLEASFFRIDDVKKMLPDDRLGVSRAILNTLYQCMNYWSTPNETRLHWSNLSSEEFDELLLHLSTHQGNRLSLMVSDLTLMKPLPIYETFNGTHTSIVERNENFTLDRSINLQDMRAYLPTSLQGKLLLDKQKFKNLYEDLNIRVLDEAAILQQFVLKEFSSMPLSQKENVIKTVLAKWGTLRNSDGFIEVLKETSFVKRRESRGHGEVVFVKASDLFDPRNELLNSIFDTDRSCFPAEEFETEESLKILEEVGLQTSVDKDTFLKCAWIVEEEQDTSKAIKLFEYFNENFGSLVDNHRGEFIRNLAEICCVPATENQSMRLCRFRDAAAPKDKHLVFNVMPMIHGSATPPQVLFSSLGLVSPPPLAVVLRQLRSLIEDESLLDHWNYKHGTIESVFSEIFSFLQDNYEDLSPNVREGLKVKAIVPIGTNFVKTSRLFFRLTKDLSPFFFEVPRAFGACDVLFRNLGVRESPKSGDYAMSLRELNKEIGSSRLNANELKSVIDVVSLAAVQQDQHPASESICAPDLTGKLVSVGELLQNDQPWLVRSQRLDLNKIHLCHPRINPELMTRLQIPLMSKVVEEILDNQHPLNFSAGNGDALQLLEQKLHSDDFISMIKGLIPNNQEKIDDSLNNLKIRRVGEIRTKFVLSRSRRSSIVDITNYSTDSSTLCFIDKEQILVSNLPFGVSCDLVVASALCDKFGIPRQYVAGVTTLLSSPTSTFDKIQVQMGLFGDQFKEELARGEPGQPLAPTDKEVASIKPLKVFKKGEIVAVRSPKDSNQLIYGVVKEFQNSSSMSRLSVTIDKGKDATFLSSDVLSLGRSKREENSTSNNHEIILSSHVVQNENDAFDDALVERSDESLKKPVTRAEVLSAVQDLLQSADMSLNDNAQTMLDSNLLLQESLAQKDKEIEAIEKKNSDIARKALKGVDSFLCPITREPMEDPVICCDGHTYERSAIEMWLRSNSRSPKTNQPLASRDLIPNHALRNSIEAMSALRESVTMDFPHLICEN